MAGTMPHAIFVETDVDGAGLVAAYAAEVPGCAVFAASDAEATAAMPRRVSAFTAWLRAKGESVPDFVGDNWYEVERAAAGPAPDGGTRRRAAFTLDELPPGDEEFAAWLRWLELAREELAQAVDNADAAAGEPLREIAAQDAAFTAELGGTPPDLPADPVDAVYVARDALAEALEAAGPLGDGVRRILRIAIADDLRVAAALRGDSDA